MAFAVEGKYQVLGIVDQTHLPKEYRDPVRINLNRRDQRARPNSLHLQITKAVLGHTHEVKMKSRDGSGSGTKEYVAALL